LCCPLSGNEPAKADRPPQNSKSIPQNKPFRIITPRIAYTSGGKQALKPFEKRVPEPEPQLAQPPLPPCKQWKKSPKGANFQHRLYITRRPKATYIAAMRNK
jgi:hypothetical protein